MHLVSNQKMARLKGNGHAFEHFRTDETTYRRYAKDILDFTIKYPELKNEETRVDLVRAWILEFDKSIWGLKTDYMSAEEIADTYARMVVGHET